MVAKACYELPWRSVFLKRIKAKIAKLINTIRVIHLKVKFVGLLFLYSITRFIIESKTKIQPIITLLFVAFFIVLN